MHPYSPPDRSFNAPFRAALLPVVSLSLVLVLAAGAVAGSPAAASASAGAGAETDEPAQSAGHEASPHPRIFADEAGLSLALNDNAEGDNAANDVDDILLPDEADDDRPAFDPVVPGTYELAERGYREGSPLDIGLVIDYVADFRERDDNEFNFREIELNLGASVDPYFDAVATIAFEPDGDVEIEEAWASTVLPGNLMAQFGREFIPFGYLNRIHVHDYPQVDIPFALEELTTDHGYIGNGGHLEWLSPLENPTLQLSLGIYDTIEHSVGRRIKGYPVVGRIQSYWESETGDHAVLAGTSALSHLDNRDNRNTPDHRTFAQTRYVLGADVRYRWQPTRERRGLIVGSEVMRQVAQVNLDGREAAVDPDDDDAIALRPYQEDAAEDGSRVRDWGVYAYAHYDFNPFYGAGYRFDYTDLLLSDGGSQLVGHSVYGEWRPSEFSRLRLQYQLRDDDRLDDREHRLLLQATLFLGWHPPHTF